MRRLTTIHEGPPILVLCINSEDILLDEELRFTPTITLRLRGLIYHSQMAKHFTSVVMDAAGTMWYHDGITTRRNCVNTGKFKDLQDRRSLHRRGEQLLCAVIYVLK
ncbi:hypothetical protein B0H16DRAFT_1296841 [Mycena metata]|uniref:Uncharacterized protein n=1 Tax=Mycena metata TaxID=1033252 RepID=A0AAD7P1M6_9AGAR|nr:hypothetical protein B0H16DRAFT_1296841 [Mycena metata]